MDAIDTFEILLDLSDRDRLYDYAMCQEFRKPEDGSWDFSKLKNCGSLEHVEDTDENTVLKVHLMDKAINDRRFLEKEKEESESSTDMDNIFGRETDGKEIPRRVLPVYHLGEVVKGKVVLELNKPIEAQKLSLHFLGQSMVSIRVYHPKGYWDQKGYEKYVNEKYNLWETHDYKKEEEDASDSFTLLDGEEKTAHSKVLARGHHEFPFEFTLPKEGGQSVPPLIPSTINYGHLVYRLKAKIDKGGVLGKGGIAVHKGLWVELPFDVAEDSSNLDEIVVEEALDTGVIWKQGRLEAKAIIPSKGHIKGESVSLRLEINNQTTGDIKSIEARIVMSGKIRVSDSRIPLSYSVNVKSEKMSEGAIPAGQYSVLKWHLPWDFSQCSMDGNLMPVGTLQDSKLLEVRYNVVVKIKRKGMHRNIEMEIPIVVGNRNSAEDNAQSRDN